MERNKIIQVYGHFRLILKIKKQIFMEKEIHGNNLRMFLGVPDHWLDHPTFRCVQGHISHVVLKTDSGDRCLKCYDKVMLTSPNDKGG